MFQKLAWAGIGAGLVAAALLSMAWQMTVDAPLLAYTALAFDRFGAVPYRDVFDFNTPGAYLAYIFAGRIFGYSEFGLRLADLACLAVLLAATAAALGQFGWRVAAAAALLFGFLYLGLGPVMSLQREYLLLLPLSAALVVAFSTGAWWLRAIAVGALVGAGATIKPQSAILLPVFLSWMAWSGNPSHPLRLAILGAVSFAVPIAGVLLWLRSIGAWPAFVEMASNYWPLYNELTGLNPSRIVAGADRWWWNAERFFLSRDLRHVLVIPAIAGAWFAFTRSTLDQARRREVALLVAVFAALQLYPLVAGKFWGYHWLPAFYGASLLAALCFVPPRETSPVARDFTAAMVVVMLTALSPGLLNLGRSAREVGAVRVSTATEIAGQLRARLRPGDTVQPLDWTDGAVHSLFLTNTRIATPFLYDFYFYHHVSHPYIQSMRARLLSDLETAKPALVVDADLLDAFEGPDTTNQFPELTHWLRSHYRAVVANSRFVIYERNEHLKENASWN